jgi:predicted negative regulator of RcsB-dependent stress response
LELSSLLLLCLLSSAHSCVQLNSLEARALLAQLFVRHHRPAEAEKELRAMLASDEDHPLSILTAARVALGSGAGKKCSEAAGALEELAERSGGATPLVAGLAAQCHLAAGRTEEAEAGLKVVLLFFCFSPFSHVS